MTKTYTHIKDLDDFKGSAALYKLSEEVNFYNSTRMELYTRYVVVSAIEGFVTETYIFPSNNCGEVLSWCELSGSYSGGTLHETALNGLGFYKE